MIPIPLLRMCVAHWTALLLCLLPLVLPREAAGDDTKSSKSSIKPGLDEAALRRVLPGSWKWKIKKNDKDGMTDILLSFDNDMNVVCSATITDGALLVSPGQSRVPLLLLQDVSTGLKSPERGPVLQLPFPGIQMKTARLLLRSIEDEKIECLDLADTDKPLKVTLVKTTDRLLRDIVGPDKPAPQPAAPENADPAGQPPEPAVAAQPRPDVPRRSLLSMFDRLKAKQDARAAEEEKMPATTDVPTQPAPHHVYIPDAGPRPVLSLFERLKTEQATKPPAESTAAVPDVPAQPPARPIHVPDAGPPRVLSVFQRMKGEQATKPPEEKTPAPATPAAPAQPAARAAYGPNGGPRPVVSVFERMKAEREKRAAEEQAAKDSGNKAPAPKAP